MIGSIVLAWAFAPFVLVALDAAAHHRVFLGVAGYYPMDGLQYLAWVRAAHDGLIQNLYGSRGAPVFVQPMYSLTGVVQGLTGVGPVAIMAFWKTVGVLVLVAGCARVVARSIPAERVGRRILALLLAIFGGFTPLVALLPGLDRFTLGTDFPRAAGDLVPAMALWDYAPLAIALGLMPFLIERLERLAAGRGDRRTALGAAALGLLVAWLHPWQGITLIAVAAGLVLWRGHEARARTRTGPARALLAAVLGAGRPLWLVAGATAAPVLYYLLLSHVDAGWATSELNSVSTAVIPGMITLTCVVPLAGIGILAARRAGPDPRIRAPLLWLLANLFTIAISPSGQYRALDGLAIPVAVLAVCAWPERRRPGRDRLLTALALTGALVPFAVFAVGAFGHLRSGAVTAYRRAQRRPGGEAGRGGRGGAAVLAPADGTAIPALTGAVSWVGHPIWTPNYAQRKVQATELFAGAMVPAQARRFVRSSGAGALVEPCGSTGVLAPVLAPLGLHPTSGLLRRLHPPPVGPADLDAPRSWPSVSSCGQGPSTLGGERSITWPEPNGIRQVKIRSRSHIEPDTSQRSRRVPATWRSSVLLAPSSRPASSGTARLSTSIRWPRPCAIVGAHKLSRRVRLGVANQRIVMRTLDLPPLKGAKEISSAVRFQAPDHIPMPLDQAVLEHHSLGIVETPEGPRTRVVVVAARRDMIDRLLDATRKAGLRQSESISQPSR